MEDTSSGSSVLSFMNAREANFIRKVLEYSEN